MGVFFVFSLASNGSQPEALIDLETLRTQNPAGIVPRLALPSPPHFRDLKFSHLPPDPNLPEGKTKDAGTAMTGT